MFDFTSINCTSVVSEPKLSESQIQLKAKEIAMRVIFADGTDNFVQTDTAKFVMPIDIEGGIRWVEISLVTKKADFSPEKAENDFMVKSEQRRLKEREKAMKKAEKNKKPIANGK